MLNPRIRRFTLWLVRLRGSPQAIALGAAIGVFVAFTPTIGFQGLIALGLATLLNANRPIAVIPTWITNPITIPPIYAFTYYLGSFFWKGPSTERVAEALVDAVKELGSLDALAFQQQLTVFLDMGFDVFVSMWIGGLIVGGVVAGATYPLTLNAVQRMRVRRNRRREKRQERRRKRRQKRRRSAESPSD